MPEKRIDTILDIIKKNGYVTVKFLCDELHYSTATINRDLNDLQRKNLIVRHYGGAELVKQKGTPLVFRYHKMRPVKRLLAKEAVKLIKDGMTVFIDGSTTTQYLGQYLTNIKNLTVISNNINLISHLSESGVKCICLGGSILESPYVTCDDSTVSQAKSYTADLCFFSSGGVSCDGTIYVGQSIELTRAMIQNSDKSVFLVDHKKLNVKTKRILCKASQLSYVISDIDFSDISAEDGNSPIYITVQTPKTQE